MINMPLRALTLAALVTSGLASGADPAARAASCLDEAVAASSEEQLVDRPQPQQLINRGGFADKAPAFVNDLCTASDVNALRDAVQAHSTALWRFAVDRAQGRVTAGDLSVGDDRPLYWTRLQFTRALRQFTPGFAISAADRATLIAEVDRHSRGQTDVTFSDTLAVKRALISGFDPFGLRDKITNANPSGAAALALDGRLIDTAQGPARIEAVLMPVRWRDFADGMVERTFAPHLPNVDLFSTISQGSPGRFDLEVNNGAWRGGHRDNEQFCYLGKAPIPGDTPTVTPQPEWTRSTLPFSTMASVAGTYPIVVDHAVDELPSEATDFPPVTEYCPEYASMYLDWFPTIHRSEGPAPGSKAWNGSGGNYLSNEIAYRATLLRDALRHPDLPGGHIHTPVLTGLGDPDQEITNPTFEANRAAISEQITQLLIAGVSTVESPALRARTRSGFH